MKNWRPKKDWNNPYSKTNVEYLDSASLICKMKDGTCMPNLIREAREHTFEAGADAMHKADVEWLDDRYAGSGCGIVEFYLTDEEWEAFKEAKE